VVGGLQPGDPPVIGPYRLVGRLGSGGMGRVYLGLSAGGRPVAVKVIRAELAADQEFRVRFAREVAAARQVSGLFTALVVGADVDGPVPWLATAYVAGPSLSEAVAGSGPMPARPALALAAGLAEGLSAIHAAGLVHCDLKPSNVLLCQDGPRVIDFGISRAAGAASAAGAGLVVGSPGFMSPEQATGGEIGPPSDVFSLGAVLTFAATGGGPFGQGSGAELAYRLVYGPPGLSGLPAELRSLVGSCLAKDPGQRPTAEQVLAAAYAAQAATRWLPDTARGALAGYLSPDHQAERHLPVRRRWRRPLAAGAAAGLIAASVAASFALGGNLRLPSAAPRALGAATSRAPASPAPEVSVPRPSASGPPAGPSSAGPSSAGPSSPGPAPQSAIVPAAVTVTSPPAARSPRPSPSPSRSHRASPSPSPSATAPGTPAPTSSQAPTGTPSPPASPSPPVPQITGVSTYQQGPLVYFDISYADPGGDAQGLGFIGVSGLRWIEGSYPLAGPGAGQVAYPLNLGCGTAWQHTAQVRAWIYDTAGASSQPVSISLSCGPAPPGATTPGPPALSPA
jgi:serine/threonine protein kinase